jgi:glutathionyl-hydroquinone reductase
MLNTEFDEFVAEKHRGVTYYPEDLREEIDGINEWSTFCYLIGYLSLTTAHSVYHKINNGVYKTGFATSQEAYEENLFPLFESLDRVEKVLDGREFLVGPGKGVLTEADIRCVHIGN